MDKISSVHQKKNPKKPKSKSKGIKVVYISNPMKVKTSASDFRALVQGLTGRDADPADMEKFLGNDGVNHDPLRIPDPAAETTNDDRGTQTTPIAVVGADRGSPTSVSSSSFDLFDDIFTPQMLENFTGSLDVFRSLESE